MSNGELSLTYGQLFEKLKELGFQQRPVTLEGKKGQVFDHPDVQEAMIVLPDRPATARVEEYYLQAVLFTLRSRGLLKETNPLLS